MSIFAQKFRPAKGRIQNQKSERVILQLTGICLTKGEEQEFKSILIQTSGPVRDVKGERFYDVRDVIIRVTQNDGIQVDD